MATQVNINFEGEGNQPERRPRKIQAGHYEYEGHEIRKSASGWEVPSINEPGLPKNYRTLSEATAGIENLKARQRRAQQMLEQVTPDDPALLKVNESTYTYRERFIYKLGKSSGARGYQIQSDPSIHKTLWEATAFLDARYQQSKEQQRIEQASRSPNIPQAFINAIEEPDYDLLRSQFKEEKADRVQELFEQRREIRRRYNEAIYENQNEFRRRRQEIREQQSAIRESGENQRVGIYSIATALRLPGYSISASLDKQFLRPDRELRIEELEKELRKLTENLKESNRVLQRDRERFASDNASAMDALMRTTFSEYIDSGFRPGSSAPRIPDMQSGIFERLPTPDISFSSVNFGSNVLRLPYYRTKPLVQPITPRNPNAGSALAVRPQESRWTYYIDPANQQQYGPTQQYYGPGGAPGGPGNRGPGGPGGIGGAGAAGAGGGGWKNFGAAALGAAGAGLSMAIAAAPIIGLVAYIANKIDEQLTKAVKVGEQSITGTVKSISTEDPMNFTSSRLQGQADMIESIPGGMPSFMKAYLAAPYRIIDSLSQSANATVQRVQRDAIGFAPNTLDSTINSKLRVLEFNMNRTSEIDSIASSIVDAKTDLQIAMMGFQNELLQTFGPILLAILAFMRSTIYIFTLMLRMLTAIFNWMTFGQGGKVINLILKVLGSARSNTHSKILSQLDRFFTGRT